MKSLFIARLVGLAALVLLSACSSTGTMAPVENHVQSGTNKGNTNAGAGIGSGIGSGNAIGGNGIGVRDAPRATITEAPATNPASNASGMSQDNDTQVGKSIYFDYNEFSVKSEYQDMLTQNFGSPKTRDSTPIRLEGNADERGSSEYNLALGQKRAEAVKKQLIILGMPEAQLEAVSFGSEKPRESCHEERCWAANRRVDLIRQGRQAGK